MNHGLVGVENKRPVLVIPSGCLAPLHLNFAAHVGKLVRYQWDDLGGLTAHLVSDNSVSGTVMVN